MYVIILKNVNKFDKKICSTGGGMTIPDWDLGGNTFVSNEYIRLTPDHQSKRGALWNNVVR
jgi:hypothetical protein